MDDTNVCGGVPLMEVFYPAGAEDTRWSYLCREHFAMAKPDLITWCEAAYMPGEDDAYRCDYATDETVSPEIWNPEEVSHRILARRRIPAGIT